MYSFWLPQNLSSNSLLLMGSLISHINSLFSHILYVGCVIGYDLTRKQAEPKKMLRRKSEGKIKLHGCPVLKDTRSLLSITGNPH